MPTTLVTGANGFLGATIVDTLLSPTHNHDTVILAVRRASAVDDLLSRNPSWPKEKLRTYVVKDITAPGAFDAAFKEFPEIDYVIHVAAPVFAPENTDFVEHYEKPNAAGTRELLASAKRHGKNVKAVSITGSINAITMGVQEDIKSRTLSSSEWLPLTRDDAIREQSPFVSVSIRPPRLAPPVQYLPTDPYRSPTASARSERRKQSGLSSRRRSRTSASPTSIQP